MTVEPPRVGRNTAFHVPALDGVRALAFLVVFLSHLPGLWMFPGGFGVTLFFFLSGYLITTLLRIEHGTTGRIDLRSFFLRRILRIGPPYYLTLVLVYVVATGSWAGFVAQAAFLGNYWVAVFGSEGLAHGSEVYWSLAVEEHFYLLFPFVAWALLAHLGSQRAGVLLFAVCGLVLVWRTVVFSVGDGATYRTDTRIDSILFGCAVALVANPVLDPAGPWMRRAARPAVVGLAALGLIASFVPRDEWFRETVRYSLQGLLLVPLYVALLARPAGRIARFLAHPWLRWLGALSYTLYLVHHAAIHLLWTALRGWPLAFIGVLALLVSIAYALLVQRLVERPLGRWRSALRPVSGGGS